MTTRTEAQRSEAKALQQVLAKQGILALYGATKGHGFWLYPADPAVVVEWFENPGFMDWDLLGPRIENDGKASGNVAFWMFKDAEKLARHELCPSDGPCLLDPQAGHTTALRTSLTK